MRLIRDPHPDPLVDPFRDGVAGLRRDGDVVGYFFSTVGSFWSPSSPRRRQWWVWYITAWRDGTRDRSEEDYPPWTVVREITEGYLDVDGGRHSGRYDVSWLDSAEAVRLRTEFSISAQDF